MVSLITDTIHELHLDLQNWGAFADDHAVGTFKLPSRQLWAFFSDLHALWERTYLCGHFSFWDYFFL